MLCDAGRDSKAVWRMEREEEEEEEEEEGGFLSIRDDQGERKVLGRGDGGWGKAVTTLDHHLVLKMPLNMRREREAGDFPLSLFLEKVNLFSIFSPLRPSLSFLVLSFPVHQRSRLQYFKQPSQAKSMVWYGR